MRASKIALNERKPLKALKSLYVRAFYNSLFFNIIYYYCTTIPLLYKLIIEVVYSRSVEGGGGGEDKKSAGTFSKMAVSLQPVRRAGSPDSGPDVGFGTP